MEMNLLPLIAQEGVFHKVMGAKGTHNAIWDFKISPQGKIYFSLCSEMIESSFARLYEYDRETQDFNLLFRLEDVVFYPQNAIRPSKLHTSISFLPNGHLLMTSHTTDKSPVHPYWMHENYYAHPWEGYQGSHIIEYDPKTKLAFSHGVPVPFESIYGGTYVEETDSFYFLGYTRGHLYSYHLGTRQIKDYGQAVEFGTFLVHKGPDGNLYFAGRSGYLTRFHIKTEAIEHIGVRFLPRPNRPDSYKNMRLDYAVNLPDGKMLLTVVHNDYVYTFDTKTDQLTCHGSFGSEQLPPDDNRLFSNLFTPVVDKEGVLWYTVTSVYPNDLHTVTLARWDLFAGGKPELLGTLGSTKTGRICSQASEAYLYDDVWYIADTNHANDMPGIFCIDLKKFRPHIYENAGASTDPYIGVQTQQYQDFCNYMGEFAAFSAENPFCVACENKRAYRLWTYVKPEHSRVKQVALSGDTVYALCGDTEAEFFFTMYGDEVSYKPVCEMTDAEHAWFRKPPLPVVGKHLPALCVPGRQYLAVVTAAAELADGSCLLGTKDGVLGIQKGDGVFRLGKLSLQGAIHDMTASEDKSVLYGVAGSADDLGCVFRFTAEHGVEEMGMLRFSGGKNPNVENSCQPCCCTISPDGKTLVIGVEDRLGCVYLLHFD